MFATYIEITEPTGINIKTASPNTQIHRVILTSANYMLILPQPDNAIHIIIGANATTSFFYIKSANDAKIHKAKYIGLRSDSTTNQKNLALILFGDSVSNEWHILGGMFAYSTDNLSNLATSDLTTAKLTVNSKEKKNETQITYFSNSSSNEIKLNLAIPLNCAAVLYFKNTTSAPTNPTNQNIVTLFTPTSVNTTFNEQPGYFYLYTGMNGGSIIVGLNDNGKITYYMIGNQL